MDWEQFRKKLYERSEAGNLRRLHQTNSRLIDFASNDYLGLARSLQLKQAISAEWEELNQRIIGIGSTGSRLLTGNIAYIEGLEDAIAKFHGCEAGLIYNCGYMANMGLLAAVAGSEDFIVYDIDVHASTYDGIRLSKASSIPFRHNDLNHLEKRLKSKCGTGNCFVCIEAVYSMDGSIAPLEEICTLARIMKPI